MTGVPLKATAAAGEGDASLFQRLANILFYFKILIYDVECAKIEGELL